MRIIILILTLVPITVWKSFAQTDVEFSHFMNNRLYFNPAYAGSEELKASLFHRNQWIGFDAAPSSQSFSIQSPINYDRFGLGLTVNNSSSGNINQFSTNMATSYRIKLSGGYLSAGTEIGLQQFSFNKANISAKDPDDDVLESGTSTLVPDIGIGLYYKADKFFLGVATKHLTKGSFNIVGSGQNSLVWTYWIMGGYKFSLNEKTSLTPYLLTKASAGATTLFDVVVQIERDNIGWIGASYLTDKTVGMQAGLNVNRLLLNRPGELKVGFAYESNMGATKSAFDSPGTMEVFLSCSLNNRPSLNKLKKEPMHKSPIYF